MAKSSKLFEHLFQRKFKIFLHVLKKYYMDFTSLSNSKGFWPTFQKYQNNFFLFLLIYGFMNLYVRYISNIKQKDNLFYFLY